MSRKTGFIVAAVLAAILGSTATVLGLSINGLTLALTITGAFAYVYGEGKADLAKIGAQIARFKDPKFWVAVVSGAVGILGTAGIITPAVADSIVAFLTLILGALFKQDPRLAKS